MDTPEETPLPRSSSVSAEAIVGIGITIGTLGVLCLLLGLAQTMRLERDSAVIFLPLGAIMVLGGGIAALMGSFRKRG